MQVSKNSFDAEFVEIMEKQSRTDRVIGIWIGIIIILFLINMLVAIILWVKLDRKQDKVILASSYTKML